MSSIWLALKTITFFLSIRQNWLKSNLWRNPDNCRYFALASGCALAQHRFRQLKTISKK
ncbi:Uncharacterized protein ChrSV_2175 [Chromobacterium vaccinii]|nr:Uncharacterized protein ChrSW_2175 [Chromobacterium vaccinii]QND89633.1 Uncharacterized protein ChrSV_2175 [Chromobacterium vaccinii]